MIVTLNGRKVDREFGADCTLQTVVDEVRAGHEDCLIVSVNVDGQHVSDDELRQLLEQPVSETAQIDLESGNPRELVRDALRGLALEYARAGQGLGDIVKKFDAGDASNGVRDVAAYIGLWQVSHRVVAQCSGLLHGDLLELEHQDRTVQAWFEDAVQKLGEIRAALEARDMVLLADLIRYELPELSQAWQELLDDVAGQIEITSYNDG